MTYLLDDGRDRSAVDVARELGCSTEVLAGLGVLWGKSAGKAGGRVNLLLCHLLDTAAVAEQMWLHFLAPWMKRLLDEVSGGAGRSLFMWLCGIHDCGKATPAFQSCDAASAGPVRAVGLTWSEVGFRQRPWRHDRAGGTLLRNLLHGMWKSDQVAWVWPLIAGHHGRFPSSAMFSSPQARGHHQGRTPQWRAVQRAVVEVFTRAVGFDGLGEVEPVRAPSKADQLALSGLIVMADWIASDERHFRGVDRLAGVSLGRSRARAVAAWRELGLRGGWGAVAVPGNGVVEARFGQPSREFQRAVEQKAREMAQPGIMLLEAPMGEGKTKAALAAAEIVAARFGLDGVFLAMPTQATCDPMFTQIRSWVDAVQVGLADQTALLHGKRMFNPEWRTLVSEVDGEVFDGIYEDDPFGVDVPAGEARRGPAEWFLGRKRGLLCPLVVGTIDQLLYAATRTKHVMLRFAGLAAKVVIVDEVHAADIYMEQFLAEALWWLGQAGVPVVLLSATVPPRQRDALVGAYLSGARGVDSSDGKTFPRSSHYPNVTAAWVAGGEEVVRPAGTDGWRDSMPVGVEVLPSVSADTANIAERVAVEAADGGVVLAVHNTVDRAQRTFHELKSRFPGEVHLLHGRLCAADRADRTQRCLDLMGPSPTAGRPQRLILVATQVAEQSFDVDADLLVTDLAPIDLLLQRLGRVHRHDGTDRPSGMQLPRVIVTGFEPGIGAPVLLRASTAIYGAHRLLRTAALVQQATVEGWSIPRDVPHLVAAVYGDEPIVPESWSEAAEAASIQWADEQRTRAHNAEPFLLTRRDEREKPTLAGLHEGAARGTHSEEDLNAVVRDGEPTIEVVIVRRSDGRYLTWNRRSLGINGEASDDVLDDVLGGTTRLPIGLSKDADAVLQPLAGWIGHPWLEHARALPVDSSGIGRVGDRQVRYDDDLGLIVGR